jgi:hypothetical protein
MPEFHQDWGNLKRAAASVVSTVSAAPPKFAGGTL